MCDQRLYNEQLAGINADNCSAPPVSEPDNESVSIDALEQYVSSMLDEETKTLRELISVVNQSVSIKISETTGKVQSNVGLTAFELEALALRIPAECLRLQGELNKFTTRNTFKDISIENKVTNALVSLKGEKGTADERKRRAESSCIDEKTLNNINKMMVRGLQGYIERADRVYEGIKKVLDYRGREAFFER